MKNTRYFYGFRYYDAKNTTWGNTGKIAGEMVCFLKELDREDWISCENLHAPSGCKEGLREKVSRKELIKMIGKENFQYGIEQFKNKIKE